MRVIKHQEKYRPGQHKVRDDITGLTTMSGRTRVQWNGLLVDDSSFEEKHPQLIIYPRNDKIAVEEARPTPEDDNDLPFGEGNASEL